MFIVTYIFNLLNRMQRSACSDMLQSSAYTATALGGKLGKRPRGGQRVWESLGDIYGACRPSSLAREAARAT